MISQELKDQIEKEAFGLYPVKLIHIGAVTTDANNSSRVAYIKAATKYAEKLEEKDKEIDNLKTELYSNAKTALDNLQHTRNNFLEELESKDHELAQLKKITKGMVKCIQAIEKNGFVGNGSEVAMNEALTAYTEWCKQNLK